MAYDNVPIILRETIKEHDIYIRAKMGTADAVQTTIYTLALERYKQYQITAEVVATDDSFLKNAGFKLIGVCINADGATATWEGYINRVNRQAQTDWEALLDLSGTDMLVKVTGVAATNIDWKMTLKAEILET